MAKGNVFMGTLKGRVGDTVFYVKQGEQNAIKYQRNISNPQSAPQMYQRSRFLAANKFYTRGRQAFFKFAYENKRKGESDFNAFMRENISLAPNITRDAYNFTNYPILGQFLVSRGSLPTMECGAAGESWFVDMDIPYPNTPISSVGDLSSLLIDSSSYEVGDIITLLFIQTNTSFGVPSLKPSDFPQSYGTPNWKIIQFKINTLDSTDLVDLGIWYGRSVNDTLQLIGDEDTNYVPSSMYCGWTCVHSRPHKGKLKVSTQQLLFNALASSANEEQRTDEIIAEVIADWRTPAEVPVKSEVILKGALTTSDTNVSGITLVGSSNSPFELTNATFNATSGIEDNETYTIGYINGSNISEGMFSAVLLEGSQDSDIQFDQVDENMVAMTLEAHGSTGQHGSFRILMRAGGQDIPIAAVSFVVGAQGVITDYITGFTDIQSVVDNLTTSDEPPTTAEMDVSDVVEHKLFDLVHKAGVTIDVANCSYTSTNVGWTARFVKNANTGNIEVYSTRAASVTSTDALTINYKGMRVIQMLYA